ncbi:MAG: DegT/DnrJ/EryC1/StrS family aminotransferase, partial [Pirellulaceae bacterium]|nr:DegT/DnrJ/EryC1/StrS family aminotransferase [Pirellulaceae bacterium]
AFEQEFAGFVRGDASCAAVSSCMAALHLAYLELGIGPGDEVLVPAQTHVATAHAVEVVGATPVFVDCELQTGNMDLDQLESLITPQTRAIGLVQLVGIPCAMDAINEIAQAHGLKVIEDCALAVGSRYKGTHVGMFGDVGCFSFYPVKHITTGDGGMLISRHQSLTERVIKTRGFGVDRTFSERQIPGMYDVPTLGFNYRMSDINAALGRVQLGRIGEILDIRKRNFAQLKALLADIDNVVVLDSPSSEFVNSHYCLSVILRNKLAERRNAIVAELRELGIGTSIYYPQPVPRMTYYRKKYGYDEARYPNATAISDEGIALPVGPHLTSDDVDSIGTTFRQICLGD